MNEHYECIACQGRGEVYAGYRDPETNAPVGIRCPHCDGAGIVETQQVICDICEQPTPSDDLCPHRSANLCGACSLDECRECSSAAVYDAEFDREPWWIAS